MYCQQEGGSAVALTTELLEATSYSWGGAHRRSLIGGCAYGIPRNSATVGAAGARRPCTESPLSRWTTGSAARSVMACLGIDEAATVDDIKAAHAAPNF